MAGASGPLRRKTIDAVEIHGNDGLGGVTLPAAAPVLSDNAVGWMAETLLSEPSGSIDILALGPLTNVAQLIERHPQAASRIGHLIVMGGAIVEKGNAGPTSEFNFAADPEATALVLVSGIRTTLIPLDVTRRIRADRDYVEGLRGTVAGDTAAALLTAYVQDEKTSRPLHDPCVMVLAVAPELFGVDSYRLSVNVSDDTDAGGLIQDEAGSPVSVAMRVDAAGVLALLAEGLR
nr:nucleoside hydrolase [Devosia aurantiaca]